MEGEIVAFNHHGAPDFAALQAALSEQKTDDLIFYAFELLFDRKADWRFRPQWRRKGRLRDLIQAGQQSSRAYPFRRTL